MAAELDRAVEAPGSTDARPRGRADAPRGSGVGPDRRFARVAAAVGVLSTAVFTWILTVGRWDLLAQRQLSDVFDLQARAMLDGHLDVAPGSLAFEGFVLDGKTYTYFGVFPSLLRMPILLVTDRFDGRLTMVSMIAAFVVAFGASAVLIDRVRTLVAGDRPWTRIGLVGAGLGLAAVGLSSNLTYLASGAWVYSEAALWGCAGVLGAFAVLAGQLRRFRPAGLGWAAVWISVAWLSRGSMGAAPTLALTVAAAGLLLGWRWLTPFTPAVPASVSPRRVGVALLLAGWVPMAIFATINVAKFDTPFSIPFSSQVNNSSFPTRLEALDEYDGNLFSPTLVPAAGWQSVRPDLVAPSAQWPFVDFTRRDPIEIGDPVWDTVEPSAGAPATMPLLVALGCIGVIATLRSRGRGPIGALVALAPMAAGAAVTAAVPLTIAFIAQRYLTDAVPLLVLTAAAGIAVGDQWTARGRPDRRTRRALLVGAAVLLVAGTWVTLSVTWLFQRFEAAPDAAATAAALRAQDRVAEQLSLPAIPVERRAAGLSRRSGLGDNLVVGDCAGLYRGDGVGWRPLERTPARGWHHLRVRWNTLDPTAPATLITLGEEGDRVAVTLRRVDEDRVELGLLRNGKDITVGPSTIEAGRDHELVVAADPDIPGVSVIVDGAQAAFGLGLGPASPSAVLGDGDGGSRPPLPAVVTPIVAGTPTCDDLTDGDP